MKLYFKQRMFSWFDSYDIYHMDDSGAVAFTVEGKLAWGHCLHILDPMGRHIATVKQQFFTFLPKFDLYIGEQCVGTICKEFTFLRPSFTLDCKGWRVEGSFMEWDYTILDAQNRQVATVSKDPLDGHLRDRCGGGARRPVCPDDRAGHRRGKMLPQLGLSNKQRIRGESHGFFV